MAVNFPSNPILDDTYTSGGRTWRFDGVGWVIQAAFALAPLASPRFTGDLSLAAVAPDASGAKTLMEAVAFTENGHSGSALAINAYDAGDVFRGSILFHGGFETDGERKVMLQIVGTSNAYPQTNLMSYGTGTDLGSGGHYMIFRPQEGFNTKSGYDWLGEHQVYADSNGSGTGHKLRVWLDGYELLQYDGSTEASVRGGKYEMIGKGTNWITTDYIISGSAEVGGTDDVVYRRAHRNAVAKPAAFIRAAGEISNAGVVNTGFFNIASATKNSTGNYTVTFDTSLGSTSMGAAAGTNNPGASVSISDTSTTVALQVVETGNNVDSGATFIIGGY